MVFYAVYPNPLEDESNEDHVIKSDEFKGQGKKKREDDVWKPGGKILRMVSGSKMYSAPTKGRNFFFHISVHIFGSISVLSTGIER